MKNMMEITEHNQLKLINNNSYVGLIAEDGDKGCIVKKNGKAFYGVCTLDDRTDNKIDKSHGYWLKATKRSYVKEWIFDSNLQAILFDDFLEFLEWYIE